MNTTTSLLWPAHYKLSRQGMLMSFPLTAYNPLALLLTWCQYTRRRVQILGAEEWCNIKVYDIHDHLKASLKQGVLRGEMKSNAGWNNILCCLQYNADWKKKKRGQKLTRFLKIVTISHPVTLLTSHCKQPPLCFLKSFWQIDGEPAQTQSERSVAGLWALLLWMRWKWWISPQVLFHLSASR